MKVIYRAFIKGTNWALAGLLSLIGFSGCGESGGEISAMYGTPSATFVFKGKVTDNAGNPIPDVPVVVSVDFAKRPGVILDNYHLYTDTVATGQNGEYIQQRQGFGGGMFDVKIVANNVEERNNPAFAADSTTLQVSDKDYKGGDGWYAGKAEKTAATIILKPKSN